MTRASIALFVLALLASGRVAAIDLSEITGLWQFPAKAVWIQINADGSIFQCRIDRDGTVISSPGKFAPPNAISWERFWDTEHIEYRAGELVVHGNRLNKDFSYIRAKGQWIMHVG